MWGAPSTRQSGKSEPDHGLGRGDLNPSAATTPGYTAWPPRYELSRSADRDIRTGEATRAAVAPVHGDALRTAAPAKAAIVPSRPPLRSPSLRIDAGQRRPARSAPGVGAGTFCSGVGASGHRRWRLLPRDRGWRAPAAGLPCISSEAFCPDAGARWHRRRGFLPRGRGWGAPAAMLRAPTARLFAPAAGLAGIDAVAFCLARKAPGVARKGRDVARKAPSLANGLPAPASGPATPAQRFPAQRPSPALRARRPAQDTHPALSCGPGNPACPGPRRCGAGSRRRW